MRNSSKKAREKTLSLLLSSFSQEELIDLISQVLKNKREEGIPISAFKSPLSGLETFVKYAREVQKKSFNEIALELNRKPSTVSSTYYHAQKKYQRKLDLSNSSITIPFSALKNREYAVLESIVLYLAKTHQLSTQRIASLLCRSPSTIRTIKYRYQRKNEQK